MKQLRGSNPSGGEIFRTCPDRPWGPPIFLYNGYRVFLGGKERPGRDADPSPPSSVVGHEKVELYLYSPLWAVRPVQSLSACTRVTFTFTFFLQISLAVRFEIGIFFISEVCTLVLKYVGDTSLVFTYQRYCECAGPSGRAV